MKLKAVFLALVGVFGLLVSSFFFPCVGDLLWGFPFLGLLSVFFGLGGLLIYFVVKGKVKGKQRRFLLLTGGSAVCFFVCVFLHNFIYGLFIVLFGPDFWQRIGLEDEPFFFLFALVVCPVGFLIGTIGSLVLFIKEKGGEEDG